MGSGTIFNIQKFSINDGPGIRTTVFMKGCPLNCLWCHNPESKGTQPDLFYDAKKCILCGACGAACENKCHSFTEQGHIFDREKCVHCGKCAENCVADALELVGYSITVEEAIREVMKDAVFYENSGGGMTLSGGEPMAQFAFTKELLTAAKEKGLHTCMETCGYASWDHYDSIRELVDIFLFDYKLTDPALHKQYTGVTNERILENLRKLDAAGAATILRCPIIPTINDTADHLAGIAKTANSLQNILEINIEPYHPLGSSKLQMLGKDYPLAALTFPENETVERWMQEIRSRTSVPVKKA